MERTEFRSSAQVREPPNIDRSRPVIEDILSPDVIAEVRENLKSQWLINNRDQYRLQLSRIWTRFDLTHPTQCETVRLDSMLQKGGARFHFIQKGKEYLFCNKATVFYWTQSAQNGGDYGPMILGSIWKTWFGALGREPQIELDEFFAVPVHVGKNGPEDIAGLLRTHKFICGQVHEMLEERKAKPEATPKSYVRPDPKYFKLHPLCEAVITVFDEYTSVEVKRHTDGYRHYDDIARNQSILLVRTGNENGLSAPITFDPLKHEALPLARNDDMGSIDIIRVPLQVGVRFIANLLCREEAAFPESVPGGSTIPKDPDHPTMQMESESLDWAYEKLARAQERGVIPAFSTAATVRKVVPMHNPDEYPPEHYAPFPFRLGWK